MPPKRRKSTTTKPMGEKPTKKNKKKNPVVVEKDADEKVVVAVPMEEEEDAVEDQKMDLTSLVSTGGGDKDNNNSSSNMNLHELYRLCVVDGDKNRQLDYVRKWEERGGLVDIVWPFLANMDNPNSKIEYFHACHLLVLFVSNHFMDGAFSGGSTTSYFDFMLLMDGTGKASETESQTTTTTTIHKVLETLLYKTSHQDYDLQSRIVHFIDIVICRSPSLDDPLLRGILPHVSTIDLWHWMPERRRELELKKSAGLRRKFAASTIPNHTMWIVTNLKTVLDLLEGNTEYGTLIKFQADETMDAPNNDVPHEVWFFLQRSLELLVDLLLLTSTRLFLVSYLDSISFSVRCRLAVGNDYAVPENLRRVQTLLARINSLLAFPIQDLTHKSLSKVDVVSMHHSRATTLQKMAYRHYPQTLQQVIYAGVGLLCSDSCVKNSYLERSFVGFSDEDMSNLLYRLRLVPEKDKTLSRSYMLQVLGYHLSIPPYPADQLKAYPLYPTERILWDLSIIPPSSTQLWTTQVLAMPKLSSQFLSFQDYLIRNFELVRLESAYEIRSDLVNAIKRVRPVLRQTSLDESEEIVLKTEFTGWSRMALELVEPVQIIEVRPPCLGETTSSKVTVEFTIDLEPCGASIRREWDEVGEFDNLFLITLDASKMSGAPAPLLKDFHLHNGAHKMWDTDDNDRRVPDEEDGSFPARFGVIYVRGCMVTQVRNEKGTVLSEPGAEVPEDQKRSTKRIFRVAMDTAQYAADSKNGSASDVYKTLNLVVRRHGRENNFKSVLETIRGLMEGAGSIGRVLPKWLQALLMGTADPTSATYNSPTMKNYALQTVGVNKPTDYLDFGDTFLDESHLRQSFQDKEVSVDGRKEMPDNPTETRRSNFKIRFTEKGSKQVVEVVSLDFPKGVAGNPVRFTPLQVEAIRSGLSPGLTLVVGPPGTGKTDVAVQIIASLFHSFPTQRTVIITHSNAALNDIFMKVMARGDVDERYLVRLGAGERDLQTSSTHVFTKIGRVAYCIQRRQQLLEQVQLLSESLGISGKAQRGADGSSAYTCETAEYFRKLHFEARKKDFELKAHVAGMTSDGDDVTALFPFPSYFQLQSVTLKGAAECFKAIERVFSELAEYRPFELLRSQRQRADYIVTKQARVVAMTCTHAAIARSNLIELGFEYDNIVMEESGQMLEIETFVPMLLQKGNTDDSMSGRSRLKRVCLLGDHNQLPPVVKNASFSKYSNLDQSMFARLIRLGVPYIQLDKQGRARPDIMKLYSWRYDNLGNLNHVVDTKKFKQANPCFRHTFQAINVDDFQGMGESTPTPYYYQNLGEAEYVVALFQYMVLMGYPPDTISILTTYNGQKELITDIVSQRCGVGTPLGGVRPRAISTVDQYQGQQNDIILLSLVRTKHIGHIRDIRRLVVAVSRARLGLYIFYRRNLFAGCHELKRTMEQFNTRPSRLQLVLGESFASTERSIDDDVEKDRVFDVQDVSHLGSIVHTMQEDLIAQAEGVDTGMSDDQK